MELTHHLDVPCAPEVLFEWVEDLVHYPAWLDIVPRAERLPRDEGEGTGRAWLVDLRARIGPVARSKRLRMVQTVHDAPKLVVFERREQDGRSHAEWSLRVEVDDLGHRSRLTVHLVYGGALWGPVLERILGEQVGRGSDRLLECVASGSPPPS